MNETAKNKQTKCPQCGIQVEYDAENEPAFLPFCSSRCQWVDLGKWLTGEYRVSKPLSTHDEEQKD